MLFSFDRLDFDSFGSVETPTIILANPNKVKIGALGVYTRAPTLRINLNEFSEVEFSIPSQTYDQNTGEFVPTPHYGDVLGKRLVLIEPFGWFRLVNPEISNDGIAEIKTVRGLSLESELMDTTIAGWDGTFPLFDILNPQNPNTILGMVTALRPSWRVGRVSPSLMNHWRTFSISEMTIYEFLKNTIQRLYQGVFIFDTYERTINMYTLQELSSSSIVSMNHDNLIKNVTSRFLDDEIVTRMAVFGAGDVSIREINPDGSVFLRNYDYFMNESWLPDETGANGLIARWTAYKALMESRRPTYSDLMVLWRVYNSSLLCATTKLSLLESQLNGHRTRQREFVSHSNSPAIQDIYNDIQNQIRQLEPRIIEQRQIIDHARAELTAVNNRLNEINAELRVEDHFTLEQLLTLDNITFSDTLVAEAFADVNVNFAGDPITSAVVNSGNLTVSGGEISTVTNEVTGLPTFQFNNNRVQFNYNAQIWNPQLQIVQNLACSVDVQIASGAATILPVSSVRPQQEFVCTLDVNSGTIQVGGTPFSITNGLITIVGVRNSHSFSATAPSLTISGGAGNIFATEANTSLGRQRVVRELFDFANNIFDKVSVPSFKFEIDSVNPFFLKEFQPVMQNFTLGNTVSVAIKEDFWLRPMLLGVDLDYENEARVTMRFSNKLRFGSNGHEFADFFETSVTGGRDSRVNKFDYLAFTGSGANNRLSEFITSALDASRQTLQNADSQDMILGGFGAIFRSANNDGSYDPRQAWFVNNQLAFTRDNWDTVSMAIGEIDFGGNSLFGVVADALVGRKIMGETMELVATDATGLTTSNFRFNGQGATITNGVLDLLSQTGRIGLNPNLGIFGGSRDGLTNAANDRIPANVGGALYARIDDIPTSAFASPTGAGLPRANFWLDMHGDSFFRGDIWTDNIYARGHIHATDGIFEGVIRARRFEDLTGRNMMDDQYRFTADFLNLLGINVLNNFIVDSLGNVTVRGNIHMGSGSTISWFNPDTPWLPGVAPPTAAQVGARPNTWVPTWANIAALSGNITGTHISHNTILTAHIGANQITAAEIAANTITGNLIAANTINASHIDVDTLRVRRIYGAGTANSFLTLDTQFGDLVWTHMGSTLFSLTNEFSPAFNIRGVSFMRTNGSTTNATGTWDFASATVTGLPPATTVGLTGILRVNDGTPNAGNITFQNGLATHWVAG